MKYATTDRWTSGDFPRQVFVVDEETGEETEHVLFYSSGKLSVQNKKADAPSEPEKVSAPSESKAGTEA